MAVANHLVSEGSPYLLQHAGNPVDWYPWGEEAFRKARAEDKPILLSIGYSTCHWCHVMERESFSDSRVSGILNRGFVAVKVDREERPDVDHLYMTAVQAMTGQGGWPLNVFLTPDLKPFYGGTYFPPEPRWGRPGFAQVLETLSELWRTDRAKLSASGDDLSRAIAKHMAGEGESAGAGGPPLKEALARCLESYKRTFDPRFGGFGGAPKFPMPVDHDFLLGEFARTGDEDALRMSAFTLGEMAKGGVRDHLGGGFHRYSTDERWRVPHFEKMLYDNAQIALNYLVLHQITGEEEPASVARETLDYVLRDMADPAGGFYSAEDADSLPPEQAGKTGRGEDERRSEGAFYLWTKKEILDVLGARAGEVFCFRYGVEDGGNAKEDPQGEFRGKNILHLARTLPETAGRFELSQPEAAGLLGEAKAKLMEARNKRPRPHRDDKVLAAWNGLMISALARAGAVLEEPRYVSAASTAARFVREGMRDASGKRLCRRWRRGERKVPAMADDYAFLIQGLLDLYEAAFDPGWLEWALELSEEQNRLFLDAEGGGFFMTAAGDDARLLSRFKPDSDNVEPSANSVSALNLLRLADLAGREDFRALAGKLLASFSAGIQERPRAFPTMLRALRRSLCAPLHIVIAGNPESSDAKALLREVRRRHIPDKTLLLADGTRGQARLSAGLPFVKDMAPIEGKAAAYVCVDLSCRLPASDPRALGGLLDEAARRPLK